MLDGRAAGGRVFKLRDYLFAWLSGLAWLSQLGTATGHRGVDVAVGRLRRSGRPGLQGLPAMGEYGQREGWPARTRGQPESRGRRVEPDPGRHQLREPDHRRPRQPGVGPFSSLLTIPAATIASRFGY